jgi:hypothetical protein
MGWAARANKKKKEAGQPEQAAPAKAEPETKVKYRATPPRRLELPRKLLR